jgi:hypothetical protein
MLPPSGPITQSTGEVRPEVAVRSGRGVVRRGDVGAGGEPLDEGHALVVRHPGMAATRATARASTSSRFADRVQRGVQHSANGVVSALVFLGEMTSCPQPPELKVTGSIPVGSTCERRHVRRSRSFRGFLRDGRRTRLRDGAAAVARGVCVGGCRRISAARRGMHCGRAGGDRLPFAGRGRLLLVELVASAQVAAGLVTNLDDHENRLHRDLPSPEATP